MVGSSGLVELDELPINEGEGCRRLARVQSAPSTPDLRHAVYLRAGRIEELQTRCCPTEGHHAVQVEVGQQVYGGLA